MKCFRSRAAAGRPMATSIAAAFCGPVRVSTILLPGPAAGFGEDVLLGVAHVRNAPVTCR
ncbi:hypothetical protein BAA13334_II00408 [Brucella abortus A13334]|nr:hypothetical protein BAA13334_II00408 [Brucella abortus A13334]